MSDPISIIALSISSAVSIIYAVKKAFKKFKSSKCHSNLQIETNDGHTHNLQFDLNKSIKNLTEMIENLQIQTTKLEASRLSSEPTYEPEITRSPQPSAARSSEPRVTRTPKPSE